MRTVTAADANRQFSKMLREVAQGATITVVSRGKPVATITPAKAGGPQRHQSRATLLERLRGQAMTGVRNWTRAELYDR